MNDQPPRLALALLTRFLPAEEALAGDLVEEFALRRSRSWFWRQTIAALAIGAFRGADHERPLRLLDRPPSLAVRGRTAAVPPRRVNLTGSPLAGAGGLTLGVLVVMMTIVAPGVWWALAVAAVLGIALGVVLIAVNRTKIG